MSKSPHPRPLDASTMTQTEMPLVPRDCFFYQNWDLTHMLLVTKLINTKYCKNPRKVTETLAYWYSYECSSRAIQWIPTWQGLDVFQKSLHPCALDKSSFSIGSVNRKFPLDLRMPPQWHSQKCLSYQNPWLWAVQHAFSIITGP